MYTPAQQQYGLFGDGWLYKLILEDGHPLVRLRPIIDKVLAKAELKLRTYYALYEGRPSFSPSVIFKMLILEYLYGLSDVAVSKICRHDFLFRWFIGVDVLDPIPDDTTLVKFRKRLREEGFREIFEELVFEAKKLGFLKRKLRFLDATHVFSDTPKLGIRALLKQGMRQAIKAVAKKSKELSETLARKYHAVLKKAGRGKEKVQEVARKAKAFVKEVKGKAGEEVDKLLSTLARVAKGNPDRLVSFTDLDARWGHKSKDFVFGGYKVHIACAANGFVTSVEVLPGNGHEGIRMKEMISAELEKGLEIEAAAMDGLYDSAENRRYLKEQKIEAYIPSRVAESEIDNFKVEADRVRCKANRYSTGKIRQEEGDLYYFSVHDCKGCKWRGKCVSAGEVRKKVYLSDCRRLRTEVRREKYKLRVVVERLFGQGKRWRGLTRARYRGLWKMGIQAIMTFAVGNLLVMVAGP